MSRAATATRRTAATEAGAGGGRIRGRIRWAARIAAWRAGGMPDDAHLIDPRSRPAWRRRDVYVYFDNDAKVRAPFDAQALRRQLGMMSR